MLNPPLTSADVGGLFETTNGERAWIIHGPDFNGKFLISIKGLDSRYFNSKGQTPSGSYTLSHRLPTSDPITELERAVVESAVAMNARLSGCDYVAAEDLLYNATDALIAARRPSPRRVDSVEDLGKAFAAARLPMTPAQASAVFNALQEMGE